jgi:hypothetical protein
MPVTPLSVVLATARTLLNDDPGALWTDSSLIPKAQQAHRELQQKLRKFSAPIMKSITGFITGGGKNDLSALATSVQLSGLPSDLIEPIKLWERAIGAPDTTFTLMTESDPLPSFVGSVPPGTPMNYWQWNPSSTGVNGSILNTIETIPSADGRTVRMLYWRSLFVPVVATDPISIDYGELYLAPRTAALAAGSVGEEKIFAAMTALSEQSLVEVLAINRGRSTPSYGMTIRP